MNWLVFRLSAFLIVMLASASATLGTEQHTRAVTTKTAHITYISGTTVYVDAGRTQGLAIGQELQVIRDGKAVVTLEVKNLASKRASCSVPEGTQLQIGDTVTWSPQEGILETPPPPGKENPKKSSKKKSGRWLRSQGLRGRLGLQYLTVRDMNGTGQGFTQPILGFRLNGTDIGGSNIDATVDVRARRTYRTSLAGATESEGRTRVYRLSASTGFADERIRLSLGRQISPSLSSVSIFDGLLVELSHRQFTLGLFSGTEPDAVTFQYSNDVFEYGAYGTLQSVRGAEKRWNVTGGFVTSSFHGTPNRSYLFLTGRYADRKLSCSLRQEVDVNSGWKSDLGEEAVSPTSTVLSIRRKLTDKISVNAGFDNRRRVRLYRDRTTPETEFNDSYRIGWSGGSELKLGSRVKVGLRARTADGATAGNSNAYIATFRVRTGRVLQSVSSRHTRYSTPVSKGWVHALSLGAGLGSRHHLELHAGIRDERLMTGEDFRNRYRWIGFDADLGLARGIYLLLSAEMNRGDVESNNQTFSGLSYRF